MGDVVCDGKPQQVVAELQPGDSGLSIPMPTELPCRRQHRYQLRRRTNRTMTNDAMEMTVASTYGQSIAPQKKRGISPVILGIVGLLARLVIGAVGPELPFGWGSSAPRPPIANNSQPPASPTPVQGQNDLAKTRDGTYSLGGTFTTGRDKEPYEYGEHQVTVGNFAIGKTEVTNAEYLDFVKETQTMRCRLTGRRLARQEYGESTCYFRFGRRRHGVRTVAVGGGQTCTQQPAADGRGMGIRGPKRGQAESVPLG